MNTLRDKIEEMKEHEKEHLEYFEKEIQKRKIKPTYLLPLWDVMGVDSWLWNCFTARKKSQLCFAQLQLKK